jgi:hypothetical protein
MHQVATNIPMANESIAIKGGIAACRVEAALTSTLALGSLIRKVPIAPPLLSSQLSAGYRFIAR